MQIGCTKKIQDEMGIVAEVPILDDDFYSWSVNVVKDGRRKVVVVINDATRFGFVLMNLKAREFKKLDQLIVDGIRKSFRSIFVTEEAIEKYLADAGEITFTKTKSAGHAAGLNSPCDYATRIIRYADKNEFYQLHITDWCNDYLIKLYKQKNYVIPSEEMARVMKERYGEPTISIVAADITIKLDAGKYQVFRRLHIPLNGSFYKLHKIIQVAFGWKDSHLHGFVVSIDNGDLEMEVISEDVEPEIIKESRLLGFDYEVSLAEYLKPSNQITYEYDFGDCWDHEITFNQMIADYDSTGVKCIMAVGDHAPEDCGGAYGYERFMEIRENPNHEEYEEMMEWLDGQEYEVLDVDDLNEKLRRL